MDEKLINQVAAFRYSLISGIVNRRDELKPGEVAAYFNEVAKNEYVIPGSKRITVGVRTLEYYKSMYEKYGHDGLKPGFISTIRNMNAENEENDEKEYDGNEKKNNSERCIIPENILKEAEKLRKERPERSVEQIIFTIEQNGLAELGSISESTLARYFRHKGLSRKDLLIKKDYGFKRFEAEFSNQLWQSDFQKTMYLPSPENPRKKKGVVLCAIVDDFSRYAIHAQFYWDEKLPRLEDTLKKAILKHGTPFQYYVDNGSVFSSHHLKNICARLGIKLSHSRPYKPQGRGKQERMFGFADTSFVPEAYSAVEKGEITTLEELNDALSSWIDGYYHLRKHGSTKEPPGERYFRGIKEDSDNKRKFTLEELTRLFYWEESRHVDKTSCVKLLGNTYEVDDSLGQSIVNLRYDPFDLSVIEVWSNGKQYKNAKPIELSNFCHNKVKFENQNEIKNRHKNIQSQELKNDVERSTLSFLAAAKKRKEKAMIQNELKYSRAGSNAGNIDKNSNESINEQEKPEVDNENG